MKALDKVSFDTQVIQALLMIPHFIEAKEFFIWKKE